jgi:hypothetical protein
MPDRHGWGAHRESRRAILPHSGGRVPVMLLALRLLHPAGRAAGPPTGSQRDGPPMGVNRDRPLSAPSTRSATHPTLQPTYRCNWQGRQRHIPALLEVHALSRTLRRKLHAGSTWFGMACTVVPDADYIQCKAHQQCWGGGTADQHKVYAQIF